MILTAVSLVLSALILLWVVYHVPIMLSGALGSGRKLGDTGGSLDGLPRFSLIVPAKDEERVIARCLRALLVLDYPRGRMEVIVVEGGSEDATGELALEFARAFPRVVEVLREEEARGKPAALNHALSHATGDIVGVFDADSVPRRDVLREVAAGFRDPSVMAVQGRTSSLNQDRNALTRLAALEKRSWFQSLINGREVVGLFVPLTGSCQFVRRRVLEEVGGWPEDALAEDVELSLKLVKRGDRVKYVPQARSREETPSRLRSLIQQRTRWYRGYMEAGLRYGSLLRSPSVKALDAEVSLMGPLIMVLCFASYVTWALTPLTNLGVPVQPPYPAVALTGLTLFTIGAALTLTERPVRWRSLAWIPLVYLYWFLQNAIACWALLQILLRRPRVWRRTEKDG